MMRSGLAAVALLAALDSRLLSQAVLIDETFDADPRQRGWVFNGAAVWVPPLDESQSCDALGLDPNDAHGDGVDDCTLRPGEGYLQVTPGLNGVDGSVFCTKRTLFDDFRLTATVELRDGNNDHPAYGMTVAIVGTDTPPAETGIGGDGMGAPCVGAPDTAPILVFTFDNWEGGRTDEGDINHVAFAYGARGLTCSDGICSAGKDPCRSDRIIKFNPLLYPLNNRAFAPVPSNRWALEVMVHAGTAAARLNAVDLGHDFGRIYTFKMPGFEPFAGYVGATASTGGARQNHILHDIRVEALPEGFCLAPPLRVERDITGQRDAAEHCGDFRAGDTLSVRLGLAEIRAAGADCSAPISVTVSETPPAGATPSRISEGGTFDASSGAITWVVTTPALIAGHVLTYDVTLPDTAGLQVFWSGSVVENIPFSEPSSIAGDDAALRDTPFDACGGIKCWNVLGAFRQPAASGPGEAPGDERIRLDYLTDGETFERDFYWYPGATIATSFGGNGITGSAADGLVDGARGRNQRGVPEVFPWNDSDGIIDLNGDAFGGDPSRVVAYAQAYVVNSTGSDLEVSIGASSDGALQILLNGEEAWIHDVARIGGEACSPQDVSPDGNRFKSPHRLMPGVNSLVVKTFEGSGAWSQAIRFQDSRGEPITAGIEIHKVPRGVCVVQPFLATRALGATGTVEIEDGSRASWHPGEAFDVSITISDLRKPSSNCGAPVAASVEESVPAGWTILEVSAGGHSNDGKVTWDLDAGDIEAGQVLGYRVQAPEGHGTVTFSGRVIDSTVVGPGAIVGEAQLHRPAGLAAQCFVNRWLLLGPYRQPGINGAAPGSANIQRDHLCDGESARETTIRPRTGDVVDTTFAPGGCSRSTGLEPTSRVDLNPGGTPTWHEWTDGDDTIDFTQVYAGDENQVMSYAVTYVEAETDLVVDMGIASDDSIQVLLDGVEIHLNNIARTDGGANSIQDVIRAASTPRLNPFRAGLHQILVKVFEGAGANSFRLRLQDPATGEGVCQGFKVCLDPDGCPDDDCAAIPSCEGAHFHRGDADQNGALQITDAIQILGFLFLGAVNNVPDCRDAADADDNGQLELTDAIRILQFLFQGDLAPPVPGPPGSACGPDPGGELGCGSYSGC